MKKLHLLLLLVVLGGTIGMFYLLCQDCNSALFFFNLGFTCLLEFLFFGSVLKIAQKRLFNIPNLAAVIQINRYVILSAILLIAYNLFGKEHFDIKWFWGALLLLTIVFTVIIIFTIQGGASQVQQSQEVKEKMVKRMDIKAEYSKLNNSLNSALSQNQNLDVNLMVEFKKSLRFLGDKIGIIPLAKFERNTEQIEVLCMSINNLNADINKLEVVANPDESKLLLKNITSRANEITQNINQLR